MDKEWKVVRPDKNCSDEYLYGLFGTSHEAECAILDEWKSQAESLIVKPVNPDVISCPVDTDYSHYIYSLIPHEEYERVMKSDASAEICCNFLTCGNDTYYHLSKIIYKDWKVIDMGCSYNAQSYLFTEHARYIAIDLPFDDYDETGWHLERFKAEGTELYEMDGVKWIEEVLPTLNLNIDKTFCICNFVPSDKVRKKVNETFMNVFNIYPCSR